MTKFGIPAQLIRLPETQSELGRISPSRSVPKLGFRQDDFFSCDFFKLIRGQIIRAAELNRQGGTIFYKNVELLANADDIDMIDPNNHAVGTAFSRLDKKAKRIGLMLNDEIPPVNK